MKTKKIINLSFVLGLFVLPSYALGQTNIQIDSLPAETLATSTCSTIFSGYVYNEAENACELQSSTSCTDPFSFKTKLDCENINIKPETVKNGPAFQTIQERAKATRESFLKRGQDTNVETNTESKDSNLDRLKSIEERVANLRERAIILSFTKVITRAQNYQIHLSQIIDRLDNKVTELKIEEKDTSTIEDQLTQVKVLSETASSTLSLALTSTESAFAGPNNPADVLNEVKTQIASTTIILEEEKNLIKLIIEELKNLI